MAATTVQTSSKKKASKPIERAESPAPSTAASVDKGGDDSFESPYIKELQKSIRNVNKKILNASKNDSLLSQHKGKSLDELVAAKVINADQKAQILKKPALQAQLAQFEEQLTQYQKIHEQYRTKAEAEKAELGQSIEKAKADATKQAKAEFEQSTRDNLLVLSQFLRLAAYRREEATDPESDESQAIEGVLLAIYAGDDTAVASMLKLVNGEEEQVLSIPGQTLETTYSSVKSLAQGYKTSLYAEGGQTDAAPESVAEPEASEPANTEAEQPTNDSVAASTTEESAPTPANQAHNGNDLSISQEWVDVKTQDATETETAAAAPAPEASSNKQSWADDQPEPAPQRAAAPADPNDGFQSVQRNRGRHEREGSGNFRGGRGRGGRGGNNRGDGRGRGRGNRNSGVPSRGPRRAEE